MQPSTKVVLLAMDGGVGVPGTVFEGNQFHCHYAVSSGAVLTLNLTALNINLNQSLQLGSPIKRLYLRANARIYTEKI